MDEQGVTRLSPRIALLVACVQWQNATVASRPFDAVSVGGAKENETRRLNTILGFGAIVPSALGRGRKVTQPRFGSYFPKVFSTSVWRERRLKL